MRFHQLSQLFYSWGWQIKHQHYTGFSDYLHAMLKRERVMAIDKDGEIVAVILFFLTDDYNKVYKKGPWELVNDNPDGHQIYIDKLVCKNFDKPMRLAIEDAITSKYPNVTEAIYHREPFDRKVTIKRRTACTA